VVRNDADSLYNYAETAPLAILSRFMFSETYAKMLRGVNAMKSTDLRSKRLTYSSNVCFA